jgi:hypothetical protein
VCLHVSEKISSVSTCVRKKWGYEKLLRVVLVVVHPVFYSHFIILLKRYDMVATTFLHIIITLCKVTQQFNVKFWREVGPTQKKETYSRDFFFFT